MFLAFPLAHVIAICHLSQLCRARYATFPAIFLFGLIPALHPQRLPLEPMDFPLIEVFSIYCGSRHLRVRISSTISRCAATFSKNERRISSSLILAACSCSRR
jgi:hypothetical protein